MMETPKIVIVIDDPTDELRMELDDFLSLATDGQCDDWSYVVQPYRPLDPANIEKHLEA